MEVEPRMKIAIAAVVIIAAVGLIAMACGGKPTPVDDSQPTPAPTYTPVPPTPTPMPTPKPPTTAPQPTIASNNLRSATGKQVTAFVEEARNLYLELQEFKDDPEFKLVGFGVCCRYNDWKIRVEEFDERVRASVGMAFTSETGFVPRELLSLGLEYVFLNPGRGDRNLVDFWEKTIEAGIAIAPPVSEGQGIVLSTDVRCKTMDTLRTWLAKLDSGDFSGADAILNGPHCVRVYMNTVVKGPLSKDILAGSPYYLFALPDGITLWFAEWEVALE